MAVNESSTDNAPTGQIHVFHDPASGMRALIAVDDLTLGPALGGCRALPYPTLEHARADALRLARGMTRKAAVARIPHGGGKSVIMLPSGAYDRGALMRAFGDAVETLQGTYITAEDSGTSLEDMQVVATRTKHVTGLSRESGGCGDPSPFTALGVLRGMEAVVHLALRRASLAGVRVAIQGVGHVGEQLARLLVEQGAQVTATDENRDRLLRVQRELGIQSVESKRIFDVECDVFAPCALGGALDAQSIAQLRCKAVAGAANNQLLTEADGELLARRGILYAPDFVINAGGLMAVAAEVNGFDESAVRERVLGIYDTVYSLCENALRTGTRPEELAEDLASCRLAEVRRTSAVSRSAARPRHDEGPSNPRA